MNVSMTVEKAGNFKEAMNASYIPTSVSNSDANNTKHSQTSMFMEEFEKRVDFIDTTAGGSAGKAAENQHNQVDKEKEPKMEDKPNHRLRQDTEPENRKAPERKVDKHIQERPDRENRKETGPEEKAGREKEIKNKENQTETQKTGENLKGKQIAANIKNNIKDIKSNIKEIIQKNQVQIKEIEKVKEDVKENFSESHKIKAGNNLEKIMLKNLEGSNEKTVNRNPRTNPNADGEAEKTNDGKNNEELNIEKKDNLPSFKNELNSVKNGKPTNTDNNVLHIANLNGKENQLLPQVKIQKLLPHKNTPEQYEVLKDKIVNTVEDSIKFMVAEGENRVSIKLHPPELGKVQVELVMKDNQVNARINTENVAVKEVILTNLDQLKSNIENAGISVNKFDVEVGGFKNQFDQHLPNGKSGRQDRGNQENPGLQDPQDSDWLPDKIIKQAAVSYFIGRSINYLV